MQVKTITLCATEKWKSDQKYILRATEPYPDAPMSSYKVSVQYLSDKTALPEKPMEMQVYLRENLWQFIDVKLRENKWDIQEINGKPVMNTQKDFVLQAFEKGFNSTNYKPAPKVLEAETVVVEVDPGQVSPIW
jgi:hypothetical protein